MSARMVLLGPPGAGKGTQAARIAERLNIPAISTGDIFRANIKNKTELGKKVLEYTSQGFLVPDELTNEIVRDRLAQDDAKNGWILDGYPRNVAQVSALDEILEGLGEQLDAVVALTAPTNVLLERMAKRAKEEGRADDTPEAIQNRLNTYDKETTPVLDIYQQRGKLVTVNGVGEIDAISEEIVKALDAKLG